MTQQATTPAAPLGKRIRTARNKINISQDEVAHRVRDLLPELRRPGGSVISRIESGAIQRPEPYVVAAIATVLGTTLEELAPEYVAEAEMIASVLTLVRTTRDEGDASSTWSRPTAGRGQHSFEIAAEIAA